jgi:hypothetical protein
MKKLPIVIATIMFLMAMAAPAGHAMRVPSRRDGDPDEVQSVKRLDEPTSGTRLTNSQGRLAKNNTSENNPALKLRRCIEVRFPGREFFLEK